MSKLCRALRDAHPGLQCSDAEPDRICYARDLWPRHHIAVRAGRIAEHRPGVVVWPTDTEQVARVVGWCAERGVEIVPFGAGSGVCSGVLPTAESVVLDVKRMCRWRSLAPERGTVDVEAGVQGIRLEEELGPAGYTVGHFPSSILCSTVGGWVAARGAGQCSGLYGKIEDMVAALECVDGRGEVATLRRRSSGVDLVPLMVGSEGVLGVITSVALRLHPFPEHRAFASLSFRDMHAGAEMIRRMYQRGLRPAVCRLYDPFDSMLAKLGAAMPGGHRNRRGAAPSMGLRALVRLLRAPAVLNGVIDGVGGAAFGGALLVLVFEGPRDDTEQQAAEARSIGRALDAKDLGPGPAEHWFERRYTISYRQAPMFMAGGFSDTMEVAAPWSTLGSLYEEVRRALRPHVLVMAHMSHAYPDGCSIYFTFAGSAPTDEACERLYDRAWADALEAVVTAGGSLSHHHGVGRSKAAKLGAELGVGIELIAAARDALDPRRVLNRGNLEAPDSKRATPARPAPTRPVLDERSQLVHVAGTHTLGDVEQVVAARGLSLGLRADRAPAPATTIDDWLARGAPGAPAPWLDPVDHLLAGYAAELGSGQV
ncbi:MAG: FAD-binding oxidoreductase, partial [Deltaproteobacteria bacterium]|nr:FAD-binding oxidoreductase [Deltaproteobacteria bacterium]MBW2537909.1 FAD-binding oxidoreductase [Deltaproteobacteria bacterium]